jgi:hypothetical protein
MSLIRAIRCEIHKPVNMTWDQLGALLRVQRRIVPQLLRAGMDARIACGVLSNQASAHAKNLIEAGLDREALADGDLQKLISAYAARVSKLAAANAAKQNLGLEARGEAAFCIAGCRSTSPATC